MTVDRKPMKQIVAQAGKGRPFTGIKLRCSSVLTDMERRPRKRQYDIMSV